MGEAYIIFQACLKNTESMRRSLCPSVKRARLSQGEPKPSNNSLSLMCVKSEEVKERKTENESDQLPKEGEKNSVEDHLDKINDLEWKNFDKIKELKRLLSTSEQAEPVALSSKDVENSTEDEGQQQMLEEKLQRLQAIEAELDEEINKRTKKDTDRHIDKLHEYNDLKDACQTIFGRLAELDQVTVKEIYERYDLNLDD